MAAPIASQDLESVFRTLRRADVDEWLAARRAEDLTLDFKLAPRAFTTADERKALAQAVSGFANAVGGLVLWGGVAKRMDDGVDALCGIQGLTDAVRFISNLQSYAGAAASPSPRGVVHRLLDDQTLAVTLVPESDAGPHMAKHGEDRYFVRSGDSFRRMEHFQVQDMFGRRRRSNLSVQPRIIRRSNFVSEGKRQRDVQIVLDLQNDGRGSAIAPFVSFAMVPSPTYRVEHKVQGNLGGFLDRIASVDNDVYRFAGGGHVVVPPNVVVPIFAIRATFPDETIPPDLQIMYELAAQDYPLESGTVQISGVKLL